MASIEICDEAEEELDALYEDFEDDAAVIDVLLDELASDSKALESLCYGTPKWEANFSTPFEVKLFEACNDRGRAVYILKPRVSSGKLSDFRVLIGHDARIDHHVVLAIFARDLNYDVTSAEFDGLLERYDRHNLPTYRAR